MQILINCLMLQCPVTPKVNNLNILDIYGHAEMASSGKTNSALNALVPYPFRWID